MAGPIDFPILGLARNREDIVRHELEVQAPAPLLDRLALPQRLHERHGTRALIVFDEFQDVLAAKERVDAVIRSVIQHHGDAASYVFAGSHVGMMRELFADRRRAFYGQAAPVELPPLSPEDVAEYVAGRFEQNGRDVGRALEPLLDIGAGHPQRTMLLAHTLFELTSRGQAASEETWREAGRAASEHAVATWDFSETRHALKTRPTTCGCSNSGACTSAAAAG